MYIYYITAIVYRSHVALLTQMKLPTISKMYGNNSICGLVKSSHIKNYHFQILLSLFHKGERESQAVAETERERERLMINPGQINLFHAAAISQVSTVWSHFFILQRGFVVLIFICYFFFTIFIFQFLRYAVCISHQHMSFQWNYHLITPCLIEKKQGY